MHDYITDDQLANAVGLEPYEFHKIVDWLKLKKPNITGRIIITDALPKMVLWAWNTDMVEDIANEILEKRSLFRMMA